MNTRRVVIAASLALLVVGGAVVRHQLKVHKNRLIRAEEHRFKAQQARTRQALFDMLQPVALANCRLERFGEAHDGGYLMCGNLLSHVQAGYSYGIAGYDQWGCDISTRLRVRVHQYDCFDATEPACPDGDTALHPECVGGAMKTEEGRFFDTIENHLAKNGDRAKRVVMKMDVEGAEWDSLLHAPDDVLETIDQLAVEFHWIRGEHQWVHDERYHAVVQRLKEFFHVVHIHFNNAACIDGLEPFPAWAYEVLFVSKRLGVLDRSRTAGGLHPLDARNNPLVEDCQPPHR